MPSFTCPTCRTDVTFTDQRPATFPFCSRRCKLVDLGRWFRGEYTIARPISPDDLDERPIPIDRFYEPHPDEDR